MNRQVRFALILTLLVVATTAMTGCTFGRARIGVMVTPDPLVIDINSEEIVGSVVLTLDGLGTFMLNEISLEFLDDQGRLIQNEHLPQGNVLPEPILLVGTLGALTTRVSLKEALGAEAVKPQVAWWYPGVPHPASCRITFLDKGRNIVGSGSVGLKWIPESWLDPII